MKILDSVFKEKKKERTEKNRIKKKKRCVAQQRVNVNWITHTTNNNNNNNNTVDSLLTDTSIRRTPLYNGQLELVPAFLYSLYLTLYKTNISLRRTASAGPKGVRLRES